MRADVPSDDGLGVDTKFLSKIERTFETSQLRNVAKHGGLIHVDRTVSSLDEANDVLVEQPLLVFVRDFADAGFTPYQLFEGVLGKHPVHAWQPQGHTSDYVGVNVPLRVLLKGGDRLHGHGFERGGC